MAVLRLSSYALQFALLAGLAHSSPRFRAASRQVFQNVSDSDSGSDTAAIGSCTQTWFDDAVAEIVAANQGLNLTVVKTPGPKKVASNGKFGGAADDPDNQQYPAIDMLPALCAVKFRVEDTRLSPTSSYDFGMFFPDVFDDGMLTVGGESFGGGIHWPNMGQGAHYGLATVSTNNGHNSPGSDTTWAKGNDAKKQDWGYRAIHGSVVLGKALTAKFYSKPATSFKSYYSGCSTGGRQGLREIMSSPESFDGVLVGAPAFDTVNISPWIGHLSKVLVDNGGAFTVQEITALILTIVDQCDGKVGTDKVADKIIGDPAACYQKFKANMSAVFCTDATRPSGFCIEETRARAVLPAFYEPYTVPATVSNPTLVSPGYDTGSEPSWLGIFGQDASGASLLDGFNMDYERNYLGLTVAGAKDYADTMVDASRTEGAGQASVPPFDIGTFKGKIILYHGLADGLLPRQNSERWYTTAAGANPSFFRYFEVPGMGHCALGNTQLQPLTPWLFGGAGQASLLRTAFGQGDGWTNFAIPRNPPTPKEDALTALMSWVGGGSAPDDFEIGSQPDVQTRKVWTRKICAYPKRPNMTGTDMTDKDSWTCA